MIKNYNDLVNLLINAPLSGTKISNNQKLAMIKEYSDALFGKKIAIPNIVVAGTKGKGSTCAVADSVIRTSGLRSCLFTSPHLVTPRERIKINGIPISEKEYVDLYSELQLELDKNKLKIPPFFAIHTLMAGLLFKYKKVDVGVIECGIGGRFDWTKIFDPTVAAITHLEYDHLDTLGSTPYSISYNKFGIYTDKSINLIVPQKEAFQKSINQLISQTNLNVKTINPEWKGKMGLMGPCCQENTALGSAAAEELLKFMKIKNYDVSKGAEKAIIHGRFQVVNIDGIQWMFDGAHTEESVKFCYRWYDSFKHNSEDDILLCATTKKRDANVLLEPFTHRKWKKIIYVEWYNDIKMKGATLVKTLKEGLNYAKQMHPKSILVTGSLHLVGDALHELGFGPQ
ncbi:hypothetical protein M9Y10_040686 [Tritrichomonas musculus]|uniref:tetrahydrofolate synthase n=1 Tax=Tritrichomonas musculus TaxID=1915356 RepID=A0ABR2K2S2_9EUKA